MIVTSAEMRIKNLEWPIELASSLPKGGARYFGSTRSGFPARGPSMVFRRQQPAVGVRDVQPSSGYPIVQAWSFAAVNALALVRRRVGPAARAGAPSPRPLRVEAPLVST